MRYWAALLGLLVSGCGGGDTVAPTPVTGAPATPTVTVVLVDTVSGASLGSSTQSIARLPAVLTLSAPGYYSRTTTVRTQGQTVDLIPENGFDLEFFRQLARNGLGGPLQPLRILDRDPSFYMQVEGATGFAAQVAAQLEGVARRIVPELTGGRLHVLQWQTGPELRAPQAGWIVIERTDNGSNLCGQALPGVLAGQIWLDSNRECNISATFAHEVGHALGFTHVLRAGSLMTGEQRGSSLNDAPTDIERLHAAIAYKRVRGNRDIDVDP